MMTPSADLMTVYRSADANAEHDASAIARLLENNGIAATLCSDKEPGVVSGSWEVRVAAPNAARAEELIARVDQDDPGKADPSHELDSVTLVEFQGTTAEIEAMGIHAILDANGIPSVVVGASTLPMLSFAIQVAAEDLERARATVAEAQAAGPAAAVEAERETEPAS